ncbi:Histidine kinase-, DNA gyrase B-, and HSP90-like ATPase [Methanolobus vulcani]|jgi:PAS domain S-box|uniref:histidine kinase n=2 Tax=Methanolobus vulcani TaxID=38026 RepID=A0A7Z7AZB7_9EURY|nr:Histidine kinase-, DNA gyrase B-, and HSP90-like ATPase [Methanolobus vulcani]
MNMKLITSESHVRLNRQPEYDSCCSLTIPGQSIYDRLSMLNNELVNIQRELIKKNLQIEFQNKRFRQTIGNITDSIAIIGPDRKIKFINDSFKRMLEIKGHSNIEGDICALIGIRYADVDDVCDFREMMGLVEGGSSFCQDVILVHNDGCEQHVEMNISRIEGNANQDSDLLLVFHDIDQRKKLEYQQAEMNEFLRVINSILRHDISNDLAVVRMSLDMMVTDENWDIAKKAIKSVDKCVQLMTRMQELESALFSDESLKSFNLRGVVASVLENYDVDFCLEGNCMVAGDEALYSVFDNMISNSITHGHADRIDVSIKGNKNFCEVSVADDGIGIPLEVQSMVFDKNFKYGSRGHTGIGLYIVKKIIERYGGEVTLRTNVPSGTIFDLKLPISL